MGWIGCDLDSTLAVYPPDNGQEIGTPIPRMKKRVLDWIAAGQEVRILTARASDPRLIPPIKKWLKDNGFPDLIVTNVKDFGMLEMYDDRAVRVEINTGKIVCYCGEECITPYER